MNVLNSNEPDFEAKLHAIEAIGEICMQSEVHFENYIEKTMKCLKNAC